MRPQHLMTLFILLALAAVSTPTPAHAGGVVSVCDEAHLLAALAGGGTVTFRCSGTIILSATIDITTDTTIDGSGQTVTISGNHAVRVFTVNSGVTLSLSELTVADGSTPDLGGGISNWGSTVIVNNSTFSGNSAFYGAGGIYNSGTLTVSNSTFSGNSTGGTHDVHVYGYGGGIYNRGTLTVSNSIFSGNSAVYRGGGIDNYGSTVVVTNSTFDDNSALYGGGGIDNWNGGMLSVSNSTFDGNRAGAGGGIFNVGGTLTMSNSTFADNSFLGGAGGGICNWEGTVTLRNTIVAYSLGGGNCAGAIADGGGNLSYPDTSCPGINGDPRLGPLQDNGGPTQTMALLPGSAAIDAADDAICAASPVNNRDQRGIARPQGLHCDIGGYEALPPRAFLPLILR